MSLIHRGISIFTSSFKKGSIMKGLLSSVVIPVGHHQRKALEVIAGWDFSREAKHTHTDLLAIGQSPSEGFLERGIMALRKYHAIAVLDPLNEHAISDVLDPFWHSQILFTDPYARFCDLTLGQFMHHYPLDHNDQREVARVRNLYEYTIRIHRKIFGVDDEEFYPAKVTDAQMVCTHANDGGGDYDRTPASRETVFALVSHGDHCDRGEASFAKNGDAIGIDFPM